MNAPERYAVLPDIQACADSRGLELDAVGVKGMRYPVTIQTRSGPLSTVATLSMTVGLPASVKGTHMSRFVEVLASHTDAIDQESFQALVHTMLQRLDATAGAIEMAFSCFIQKNAPVSGQPSLLDFDVVWYGEVGPDGAYRFRTRVTVPVTSLCPCSKEISDYGAHNQRSLIGIEAEVTQSVAVEDLVAIAERNASCEVYGLLKRADEKYVTERAYDNPKFVEDLVRDVALALKRDPRVRAWKVEVENFESIHNHSAFARVASDGAAATAIALGEAKP
jgi:GTP cyclohydrolase IB